LVRIRAAAVKKQISGRVRVNENGRFQAISAPFKACNDTLSRAEQRKIGGERVK
jgi:hypothetical protein